MGERKSREGVVVCDAMQKTRVVRIERVFRHPRYQRVVRTSKKLKAHDETNESRVGDRVLIEETRPLSKEKRWRIRKVLSRVSSTMIQPRSMLDVADNSGAKKVQCIRVMGGANKRYASLGRHRHRRHQGGDAGRDREEGRSGPRGRGADGQGSPAAGRIVHPLRPSTRWC